MKNLDKYDVSSQQIYIDIQNTNNVVTKSTLLDILKNRAERHDIDALRIWLVSLKELAFKRNTYAFNYFNVDICVKHIEKHLNSDISFFKGLNSIEIEYESVNNYYTKNKELEDDKDIPPNLLTMFIIGILLNYYIAVLNESKSVRNEFKAVSNLLIYGKLS